MYIYFKIFTKMPRNENLGMGTKYSNAQTTLTAGEIAELYSKFLIEKNAKNTAYFFILSNNLMKQFMQFCKNYNSTDPHGDCVEYLLTTLSKENKL